METFVLVHLVLLVVVGICLLGRDVSMDHPCGMGQNPSSVGVQCRVPLSLDLNAAAIAAGADHVDLSDLVPNQNLSFIFLDHNH